MIIIIREFNGGLAIKEGSIGIGGIYQGLGGLNSPVMILYNLAFASNHSADRVYIL